MPKFLVVAESETSLSFMRTLLPTLMVVFALVFILMMSLQAHADDDDAELKHDKEPKGQLIFNQTTFGRKASAGGKDAEEVGERKNSSQSGYMTDSDDNPTNNSALHLNNHHYFTDPRKLPPRN